MHCFRKSPKLFQCLCLKLLINHVSSVEWEDIPNSVYPVFAQNSFVELLLDNSILSDIIHILHNLWGTFNVFSIALRAYKWITFLRDEFSLLPLRKLYSLSLTTVLPSLRAHLELLLSESWLQMYNYIENAWNELITIELWGAKCTCFLLDINFKN